MDSGKQLVEEKCLCLDSGTGSQIEIRNFNAWLCVSPHILVCISDHALHCRRIWAVDNKKIIKPESSSRAPQLNLFTSWHEKVTQLNSFFSLWVVTWSPTKKAPGQILWEYTGLLGYEHFTLECCTTKTWSKTTVSASGCGRWKKGGNKGEASEDKSKTLEGPTPPPFPFFLFLCLSVFSKRKQVVQDRATAFFSLLCTVAVITWVSQRKLGNWSSQKSSQPYSVMGLN